MKNINNLFTSNINNKLNKNKKKIEIKDLTRIP